MRIINNVLLTSLCVLPPYLMAARVPEPSGAAGVVDREIQREYAPAHPIAPSQEIPVIEVEIPKEQFELHDDETIEVKKIVFKGHHIHSAHELDSIAASYLGRELKMKDIRHLCIDLQTEYIRKGYLLARAFPPPQEIQDGKLIIEIMEGELGEIKVIGNKHYHSHFIKSYFSYLRGKALNYHEVLRALLLLNESNELRAGVVFKKGTKRGTADLIVRVDDKRPLHAYVDYNNYGTPVNTQHRSGVRVDAGNLFRDGDMLTVVDVVGYPLKRLEFADAIYSIPLNAKGTTLTLSYLYSHFRVARFHELRLKGDSNIASIKLTQALKRTKSLSTNAYVNFDYKQIRNLTLNEVTSFDKLRVLELGMTFDYIDPIKGRNVIDVYEDIGLPRFLGGLKAIDDRASRQGSGGMFFITSLDYERIQPLPKDIFLITNLFGQYCPNKLPLAQQFYIGGFDTVRGFKAAVALGDSGYFVNLELRFPPFGIADKKVPEMKKTWKEFIQFIGFIDHGDVFLKNGPRSEGLKSHTSLTGAGAGVRIYGPYRFNFSLDVGFPLTETDRPSDSVIYLKVSWNPL